MTTNVLMLYAPNGGASPCIVLADIIRHLPRDTFRLTVAVDPGLGDDTMGASTNADGTELVRPSFGTAFAALRQRPGTAVVDLARSFASLVSLVRRRNIDVIHVNDDRVSMPIALALSTLTGVPYLVHFHNLPNTHDGWRFRMTQELSRRAACCVGCSRFIGEEIAAAGVPAGRVAFAHNGTDTDRFAPTVDGAAVRRELGIAENAIVAMEIARIWRPKRQEDFVRAIALARAKDPRIVGVIVGWDDPRYDGPFPSYRAELNALATELGVGSAVHILNARKDVEALHAASEISVLPSIREPFGLVVTEAMATERPVVAARSGGIREIVRDGVDGYLVDERAPAAIAERLVALAADPELRRAMGRRGRARVLAQFRDVHVAERFGRLYEAIARRAPIPADLALETPGHGNGAVAADASA